MKSKMLLTTIVTCLTHSATAKEVLASKEGPFKKYNKCALTDTTGTLEIGNPFSYHLLETSSHYDYFYDLEGLVRPAVAGAQARPRRWYPTQTNYHIRNSRGSLVKFYALGVTNIDNDTTEAKTLKNKINDICDNQLNDFNILGEFQIDLQIGNQIFKDKLVVKRTQELYGIAIEGVYIVPGSFKSKITKLNYKNGTFSFIIRVQEGEDDYRAVFEGFLNADGQLKGKAFILPEREELGVFTGKKN